MAGSAVRTFEQLVHKSLRITRLVARGHPRRQDVRQADVCLYFQFLHQSLVPAGARLDDVGFRITFKVDHSWGVNLHAKTHAVSEWVGLRAILTRIPFKLVA